MFNVKIRHEAEEDLKEAFDWFELAKEDLGKRFILLVKEYINELKHHPKQYQLVHKNKRSVHIKGFPYQIIYSIYESDVVVFSVFHAKRNPKIWKKRKENSR